MKKHSLFVTVLLIVALLSLATPAATAAESVRVGDRLSLFRCDSNIPGRAALPHCSRLVESDQYTWCRVIQVFAGCGWFPC